jgi:hypothetical protein
LQRDDGHPDRGVFERAPEPLRALAERGLHPRPLGHVPRDREHGGAAVVGDQTHPHLNGQRRPVVPAVQAGDGRGPRPLRAGPSVGDLLGMKVQLHVGDGQPEQRLSQARRLTSRKRPLRSCRNIVRRVLGQPRPVHS